MTELSSLPSSGYGWLMLIGIAVSLTLWSRIAKRDDRLFPIYIAALTAAFVGAKLVYLAAEGWMHWHDSDRWIQLATGKSVLGALLGGYAGVELAKYFMGYRNPTGDWFAIIAPLGILLGRIGCLLHGCCLGQICQPAWYTLTDSSGLTRWPAVPLELAFNALALVGVFLLRQTRSLPGQHFHLYLIGYGVFRFLHEFVRDTPRLLGPLSGYALAALAVTCLGLIRFIGRAGALRRHSASTPD